MAIDVQQIKDQCNGLSSEERADLAYHLIRSLDDSDDPDVADAWREEVGRRISEIRAGQVVGIPAVQVFAEIRARET